MVDEAVHSSMCMMMYEDTHKAYDATHMHAHTQYGHRRIKLSIKMCNVV
jgi:hypothetical protein